jgi:phosphate-selective porin OprO and OprP
MTIYRKAFMAALLAGAASLALASAAEADGKPQSDGTSAPGASTDAQIQALESEIQDLSTQVQDLKRSTSDQYTDVRRVQDEPPAFKFSLDGGRPTFSTADGNFTAAIRTLAQLDWGYYSQSAAASALPASYGPDLSSGANFRRVYLGVQGKVFGDWSYNFNYDFGGSGGTETPGHIQSVYLEYDGLGPLAFRVGAFPPPANIEDGTSAGDTIFLERNSPSDLQRNIAGGDGRDAITILYTGPTVFGALSYTGDKIQDGAKALAAAGATAAPVYGEQEAALGRLSYLPISTDDAHWLIGVNGTYVIRPPDSVPRGTATLSTTPGATALNSITLSDPPELTVDSNGVALASTGALPANHVSQWGVETAGNFQNFYGQAGYYGFEVDRAPVAYKTYSSSTVTATSIVQPSKNSFDGWYAQASWVLTGESKGYSPATGAFTPPKPAHPFSLSKGEWGAFELAARYSDLNLNSHALDDASVITNWTGTATKTYTFYNTVRGGDQRIATLGLNWYPNSAVRFAINYELVQVSRLQTPGTVTTTGVPGLPTLNGGQNLQTIALRAQIGF